MKQTKTFASGFPIMLDDEVKCSECPNASHGFDRNASHNAGRYVCECESHTCHAESLRQQLAEKDAEMRKMQNDFCKAIDHAISLDIEGVYFLSCWNDGDWDTCREFGFEPSDALTSPKFVKDSTA